MRGRLTSLRWSRADDYPHVVTLVRAVSIQENRLLVACCVSSILSKVCVVVAGQRCHGNTAGECEDDDHCGYEGLHGGPRLVLGRNGFGTLSP
jgi:hypothetical protein